ncbi:hypothetical protein [Halomonas sp. BM-2019]|uniref:hypothetical protein n=1 Tax=Halomonas sp. BM-2019 TaxID=2811227 RepID=UPI001B3C216E|nr:MAG: hypothetical protein J5F18_07530 [Halomonas sp. BM-2019]
MRWINWFERKVEALEGTHAVLLVIGAVGIFLHLAHLAGFHIIKATTQNLAFLLSLLCIGIGLGQLKIAKLNHQLTHDVRCMAHGFTVPKDAIVPTLSLLVGDAKERIRATHFTTIETPEGYLDVLSRSLRNGVGYQVIVGYDSENISEARKHAEARRSRLEEEGCNPNTCNFKFMGVVWGLDLLIVDQRHLFIGFPKIMGEQGLQSGVVYWNDPALVASIIDWYDTHLWENAER